MTDINVREKVIDGVASAMHTIFKSIPEEDFRSEADALMQKWTEKHPRFGMDGIVEALLWWQNEASETNAFPLTRN